MTYSWFDLLSKWNYPGIIKWDPLWRSNKQQMRARLEGFAVKYNALVWVGVISWRLLPFQKPAACAWVFAIPNRKGSSSNGQLVNISNDSQTTLIYIYISLSLSLSLYIFQYTYSIHYLFFKNIFQLYAKHIFIHRVYKKLFSFWNKRTAEVSSSGWWEYATWPDPGSNPGSVSPTFSVNHVVMTASHVEDDWCSISLL